MDQPIHTTPAFRIAVLTVSDSRSVDDDRSGDALVAHVAQDGHALADRRLVTDDVYEIRAVVSSWIADGAVDVVISTGGTGPTGRDKTVAAVRALLDRELTGFGELFRRLSYEEIGSAAILSNALGGIANGTFVFCLPGSTSACHSAWNGILSEQLAREGPSCRLASLRSRLLESGRPGPD